MIASCWRPRACPKLRRLYETGGINKYDAPILNPLARSILDGSGVKEEDLATIERLTAKYKV